MIIEIDEKKFIESKLTYNEWFFLSNYVLKTNYSFPLANLSAHPVIDIDKIERLGFVKILEDGTVVTKDKAVQLFVADALVVKWYEFKGKYPIKSQIRRLHDNPEGCKKKYMQLISANINLHDDILKGLDGEYLARRDAAKKNLFFPEWKLMSVYLNQKHHLVYLDYETEVDENVEKKANYGEDI